MHANQHALEKCDCAPVAGQQNKGCRKRHCCSSQRPQTAQCLKTFLICCSRSSLEDIKMAHAEIRRWWSIFAARRLFLITTALESSFCADKKRVFVAAVASRCQINNARERWRYWFPTFNKLMVKTPHPWDVTVPEKTTFHLRTFLAGKKLARNGELKRPQMQKKERELIGPKARIWCIDW